MARNIHLKTFRLLVLPIKPDYSTARIFLATGGRRRRTRKGREAKPERERAAKSHRIPAEQDCFPVRREETLQPEGFSLILGLNFGVNNGGMPLFRVGTFLEYIECLERAEREKVAQAAIRREGKEVVARTQGKRWWSAGGEELT
jgi:hypothetical protein